MHRSSASACGCGIVMVRERMSNSYAFVTECTLGKLAKLLRMAGFDTTHDPGLPAPERLAGLCRNPEKVLLSRTRHVVQAATAAGVDALLIVENDPENQFRQVMRELNLGMTNFRPLTRCIACNQPLKGCSKEAVVLRVPEYIFQKYQDFSCCSACKRVYWPGTHADRMFLRLRRLASCKQ